MAPGSGQTSGAPRVGKAPGWLTHCFRFVVAWWHLAVFCTEDFSRLHPEHREAIAGSCQIRCLPRGRARPLWHARLPQQFSAYKQVRSKNGRPVAQLVDRSAASE